MARPGNGPQGRGYRNRAFTLLEIMLAVAILGLMALAIYRFVQAHIVAIRASSEASASDSQYAGLRDLLTAQWQSLAGGTAALTGQPLKLNDRSRDEIRWNCRSGPGLLTRYAAGDYSVTMRLQRPDDKTDRLDLGFLRAPQVTDHSPVDNSSTWVPLIENVQSMQIRYFDPRLNSWLDRWSDTITLPRLIKIVIARNDAPAPWEMIVALGRTPL